MYSVRDPKLMRWLREHPVDTAKAGPLLDLPPVAPGGSSPSTSPAPGPPTGVPADGSAAQAPEAPVPPPPGVPGDVLVLDGADESDFTKVVSLLVAHGVEPADAQRYVCGVVKA